MEEPKTEHETKPKKIWKWWQVLFIVLFLPYVLLFLGSKYLWRRKWSAPKRIGAIVALWFFSAIIGMSYIGSQNSAVGSANITPYPTEIHINIPTTAPTDTPTPEPTAIGTPTPTPTYYPQKVYLPPTEIPTQKPIQKPLYFAPTTSPAQNYIAPPVESNSNSGGSIITGGSGGNTNSSGGTSCNCSLTCQQISSCVEAQYQLNTCGCSERDGDHDGIACDGAPLHCQN